MSLGNIFNQWFLDPWVSHSSHREDNRGLIIKMARMALFFQLATNCKWPGIWKLLLSLEAPLPTPQIQEKIFSLNFFTFIWREWQRDREIERSPHTLVEIREQFIGVYSFLINGLQRLSSSHQACLANALDQNHLASSPTDFRLSKSHCDHLYS